MLELVPKAQVSLELSLAKVREQNLKQNLQYSVAGSFELVRISNKIEFLYIPLAASCASLGTGTRTGSL